MCEGFRTLGFRKEIDCFTMPAVYTRARMQMCHLKTKTFESLSLDFPEMDVPFMFLGGTVTKAKGDYNPNRYYEKICMLYMHKYANIYIYDIFIYIYIRDFAYICVIHYLPPTLSQYLFPIKLQPPSTHTPSSRNQGRP